MSSQHANSEFVAHEPCPACGSSDANSRYTDGHTFCFACNHYGHPEGEPETQPRRAKMGSKDLLPFGEFRPLTKRGITEETARKFGYFTTTHHDKPVQVAPYYKDGEVVGQKVRYPDKTFSVRGKVSDCLFGANLWRQGGRMIVVTEGEIDAMSVSQVQGNKWPVVSIPNGAQGAAKSIAANLDYLLGFEKVILMFDMDEPGQEAIPEVARLFPPGKVHVAKLALKDANELLQAGRASEIVSAIWDARPYRPDGLVEVEDVIEKALAPVEMGYSWCFETLTALTYGRRPGEIYGVGAGTGVGKTDFLTQQVAHDISLGLKPAVYFLEQLPEETLARVAGKVAGKAFHIPDAGWTEAERRAAFEALRGKFSMYDSFGVNDWVVLKEKIRYRAAAEGCVMHYVDHLTALADPSNERESIEIAMREMAQMAIELRICIIFVSHLATPEGKPHEEGGRVMIRHFKGARAIGFWSHFMFGLERNQQAESDKERSLTTFRILKDRKTGRSTGKVFYLTYDPDTTYLHETTPDDPDDTDWGDDEPQKDF